MSYHLLHAWVWQHTLRHHVRHHVRHRLMSDESGEGVISTAIAVLVMAFLGVLMWQLFRATLTDANSNVNDQIDTIK